MLPGSPLSWRIANRSRESCTGHPVATKTRHRHRRLAQCEVAHGSFRAHRQAPVVTTQARQDKEKRRRAACYGSPGRRRHASSPECLPRAASALGERAERRPIRQHPCPCCRPEWRVPRPPMTCELAPYGSLQRESHVRSRPRAAGTESLLGLNQGDFSENGTDLVTSFFSHHPKEVFAMDFSGRISAPLPTCLGGNNTSSEARPSRVRLDRLAGKAKDRLGICRIVRVIATICPPKHRM